MSRRLLVPFSIGLLVILVAVVWVLYIQRGAHIEPKGSVLKVRIQPLEDNSAVAVVDFRINNTSDYSVVVREVTVSIEDADKKAVDGTTVSEMDAKRLFQYYPLLGQKFNDSLLMRDKIAPHETIDRMIAARFEVPESQIEKRKNLKIRVQDVDGPVAEIREH